jgi:Cys-tRNA(Pro) deacylase
MQNEKGEPLLVLQHGDRKVSTKELARAAQVKRIFPCKPEDAQRHSGYLVGGTSPFGTRKRMPVYLERSVLDLEVLYINGGRRGYLLGMKPSELVRVLSPILVEVGLEE